MNQERLSSIVWRIMRIGLVLGVVGMGIVTFVPMPTGVRVGGPICIIGIIMFAGPIFVGSMKTH